MPKLKLDQAPACPQHTNNNTTPRAAGAGPKPQANSGSLGRRVGRQDHELPFITHAISHPCSKYFHLHLSSLPQSSALAIPSCCCSSSSACTWLHLVLFVARAWQGAQVNCCSRGAAQCYPSTSGGYRSLALITLLSPVWWVVFSCNQLWLWIGSEFSLSVDTVLKSGAGRVSLFWGLPCICDVVECLDLWM